MRIPSLKNRQGFTLIEMMVVVVILGIFIGMFYLVWVTNWSSFEHHITQADLWNDANQIFERISLDAREAKTINRSADGKTATLLDAGLVEIAVYQIMGNGNLQMKRGANPLLVLSRNIDFATSSFEMKGRALAVNLSLSDRIYSHYVRIAANTEIYPRN